MCETNNLSQNEQRQVRRRYEHFFTRRTQTRRKGRTLFPPANTDWAEDTNNFSPQRTQIRRKGGTFFPSTKTDTAEETKNFSPYEHRLDGRDEYFSPSEHRLGGREEHYLSLYPWKIHFLGIQPSS